MKLEILVVGGSVLENLAKCTSECGEKCSSAGCMHARGKLVATNTLKYLMLEKLKLDWR